MRKLLTFLILINSILYVGCKNYQTNIEDYLSYWSSEAAIIEYSVDPAVTLQTDKEGIQSIPSTVSGKDIAITLTVRNPKNFNFKMPDQPTASADIVVFRHGVEGSAGTNLPVQGTDYTLTQASGSKLMLRYTTSFLTKHEYGQSNIGSTITLYADDGRKFSQTFTFNIKANTPPPDLTYRAIGKTAAPDAQGKYYYVLFFEAKGMDAKVNSLPLHKDIANLSIAEGSGTYSAVPLKCKDDGSGFDISGAAGTLLDAGETAQLVPADIEGDSSPDTLPSSSEKWILRVKTNAEVLLGTKQQYRLQLQDTAGLSSVHEVVTSTSTNKVKPIDITVQSGYLAVTKKSGTETDPHEITYQSKVEKILLLAQTPTDGAEIHYSLERNGSAVHKNSGITPLTIEMPAVANAVYKLTAWAVKNGFDTSPETVVYYKATFLSGLEISSGPQAWTELKTAVSGASDGDVFFINGTIQATADGNYGEIPITKKITIKSKNGNAETAILDANKAGLASNAHRIFTVKSGGELTLENLTLTNGKVSGIDDGGAVQIENDGMLTMTGCIIRHCESEGSGGALYTAGTLTINGGMVGGEGNAGNYAGKTGGGIFIWQGHCTLKDVTIQGNTVATSGRAAGVFLKQSDSAVLTIEGNTKIGTADDPASNSVYLDRQDSSKSACISAGILGTAAHINVQPDNYLGQRDKPLVKGTALSGVVQVFKLVDLPSGEEWELRANAADTELVLNRAALTITSGTGAWLRLKQAVEDAKDGDVITISGTIQATKDQVSLDGISSPEANSGEIEITKHITIKGKSGTAATDVLDANSSRDVPSSVTNKPDTAHRIFKVTGSSAVLTLENVTLKNGKAADTFGDKGGAVFLNEGSQLSLENVNIEHCEAAQNGGALSIGERCKAIMKGGQIGTNTVAAAGSGRGVFLNTESVFNMSGSAQVAADNDVYLAKHDSDVNKHAKITVTGALSQTFAAKITLHHTDYTAGRIVVQGSEASGETPYQLTEADIQKFTVAPNEAHKWTTQLKANTLTLVHLINGADGEAWKQLKEAVTGAGANETIVIQGMVKATNAPGNSSEIEITRNITIKGISGTAANDGLDANSNDTPSLPADRPSAPHRILKVTGSDTTLTLKNVTLKNGRATGSAQNSQGGGILVLGGTLVMNGSTLTGCKAGDSGGGIYFNGRTLTLETGTVISGNSSHNGGGIYAMNTPELAIKQGSSIRNNTAAERGGGMYLNGGTCTFSGSMSGNTAQDGGGFAIAPDTNGTNTTLIMTSGADISSCTAGKYGGGVYIYAAPGKTAECKMAGGTISNCVVKNAGISPLTGGGVYVDRFDTSCTAHFTMSGGSITGCKAQATDFGGAAAGGGVSLAKGAFTMSGGSITDCTAEYDPATPGSHSAAGGGVYVKVESTFTMSGSAVITPSKDRNIQQKKFNDVYLEESVADHAKIDLTGVLSPQGGTAARLTFGTYSSGMQVLTGNISTGENYKRFAVTPGGSPIEKIWYIDSNGKLTQFSP